MTKPPSRRDQRIADETYTDQALLCSAHGCPALWSVDGPRGRCCSAHAWSDRPMWPRITEEVKDREAHAALRRTQEASQPAPEPRYSFSPSRKRELWRAAMTKLAVVGASRVNGRTLAKALADRVAAGYKATLAQKQFIAANVGQAVVAKLDAEQQPQRELLEHDDLAAWASADLPLEEAAP